ncbi:MAG: transposase, partial [Acidobacteriota bacterium]|nr:transposase [Acidobacteriota bacterium]
MKRIENPNVRGVCTQGILREDCIIRIFTVSCREAGFRLTTTAGFDRSIPSSCTVAVLSEVFRAKFVEGLRKLCKKGKLNFGGSTAELRSRKRFAAFADELFAKKWVVYAKPAFGGPAQVLRYLGRYTYRVAISNHRLMNFDGENVTFRWRDYAHGNKKRDRSIEVTGELVYDAQVLLDGDWSVVPSLEFVHHN